ncbi:PREDICTED: coiled-coil domain-containing protein 157 [Aptenodytes forsteri]|uniref:coiled-coil domain-containing protein 157 n=1 Tax=Aptenodytes forsteri TaxID=9233 RepID=UPI0009046FB7|nr:PREDICTED: coiled-coil domain-containing protein 157 [Aptenodytes forsteri]
MLATKEQRKPWLRSGAEGSWADGGRLVKLPPETLETLRRLLLLLQSFTGYAENLLSERAIPPARAVGPCMSAGLTARRYWCSMLKLGAFYQQLLAEKKACRKEIPTLQPTSQAGKPEKEHPKHCLPDVLELRTSTEVAQSTSLCPSLRARVPGGGASGSSLPRAACSTAESSRSIPTQTTGSSLGPCDTCASAQTSLHEVGKAITSICQSQNIPSALSRFQEMVEESTGRRTLSATDMSYWASEQSKDLSRISKHLQMLLQQVNPLKSQLEESEKQKDKLRKQVGDFSRLLQAEKETQAQQKKEAEQNLEVKNNEYLKAVARLERDKDDLRRGAALLEERLSTLKEELAAKQAAVQELEVTKTTLLEEMRTTMVARSRVLELEEKVQLLTGQRESLGQELSTTTTQLEKEKAKVESMLRHQESLQAKQRALLQQLDSLDQEREELQASLGEAEEDKARLAEQLEESRERSGQQLQAQQELLDTLRREKLSLEQSVSALQANVSKLEEQARELKERERLLVFFPELHVPTEMQFESTGSLTEDMEKQLQANSIRIGVLEQENARLRSALAKVKAAAEQGVLKEPILASRQLNRVLLPDAFRTRAAKPMLERCSVLAAAGGQTQTRSGTSPVPGCSQGQHTKTQLRSQLSSQRAARADGQDAGSSRRPSCGLSSAASAVERLTGRMQGGRAAEAAGIAQGRTDTQARPGSELPAASGQSRSQHSLHAKPDPASRSRLRAWCSAPLSQEGEAEHPTSPLTAPVATANKRSWD